MGKKAKRYVYKKTEKHIKEKESKEKKGLRILGSIFIYLLLLVFLAVMCISGIQIYKWFRDNSNNNKVIQNISNKVTIDETKEDTDKEKYTVDFANLKSENPDTVGWIKVNGVNIEYPVVKSSDNNYYLTHSFDKSENMAGWIFADYRDKIDGSDKNIIIYGHNRKDGSMFGTMKKILSPEWYNNENNRKVVFCTENENSIYEVFSVYRVEREDYYIQTAFADNDSYKKFLDTIKKRSVKDFGQDVTENDKILTLSTCDNNGEYRVVLHAKKICK